MFAVGSKEYLVFPFCLSKVNWHYQRKRHQVFGTSFTDGFFPFWEQDPTEAAESFHGMLVNVIWVGKGAGGYGDHERQLSQTTL